MDDAGRMRGGQGIRDLDGVADGIVEDEGLPRESPASSVPPANQLHGQIGRSRPSDPDIEDRDDVGVLERGRQLRFLHEATAPLRLGP